MTELDSNEEIEWDVLETLDKFLKPFFDLTEKLSGDKYATLSMVHTCTPLLFKHVESFVTDSAVGGAALAFRYKLIEYEEYLRNDIAITATILDPRSKLSFLPLENREHEERMLINRVESRELELISYHSSQNNEKNTESIFDEAYVREGELNEVTHYLGSPREPLKVDSLK